jgi:hypothetical protein
MTKLLLVSALLLGSGSACLPASPMFLSPAAVPSEISYPFLPQEPEWPSHLEPLPALSSEWMGPALRSKAVPLPQANTREDRFHRPRHLGRALYSDGHARFFLPEIVLVKFKEATHVATLRVEPLQELEALKAMGKRQDVQFAELNLLQERQFVPNDPELATQWHHALLGSSQAWSISMGSSAIQIAIVDTPFQMDHPDLAANTAPGYSVITHEPITESPGIEHSTFSAGMAAAVVHNALGVAGAGNCRLLPIHINGFTDEMYDAIVWAADHGIRVVNISWSGADSPSLNEAGLYLKERARGVLAMSGLNGSGSLNLPNQPHIYAISMTDAADNPQSSSGPHIDFAAPGFNVYSTTTASIYMAGTGTSYSTPLFAGIVAVLLSINPTLSSDEVIELLKTTADDKGQPGWDPFFGWGRIHFGRAAVLAQATLPRVTSMLRERGELFISSLARPGIEYSLWAASTLNPPDWAELLPVRRTMNGGDVTFRFPEPESEAVFYRIGAQVETEP